MSDRGRYGRSSQQPDDQDLVPLNTEKIEIEDLSMDAVPQTIEKTFAGMTTRAPSSSAAPEVKLGPKSSMVDCPYCQACVKTSVEFTTTTRTHIVAVLRCLICCFCACCTYCSASARNSDHYCPNCKRFLGTYKK